MVCIPDVATLNHSSFIFEEEIILYWHVANKFGYIIILVGGGTKHSTDILFFCHFY